jgi:pilus assembly protein CpaE
MKPADLLLLTQEDPTIAAVRSALEVDTQPDIAGLATPARGRLDPANICHSLMDLRARLSRRPLNGTPRVALVDIDRDADRILSELSAISAMHASTWFIVLSKEFDERRVLHAMQAGARHFLRKDAIATELEPALERLLVHGSQTPTRLGTILSIFSCSGGCGATTAVVNLATELRQAFAQRVLIVDLDEHYGAAAAYLGLAGRYGIGHILSREGPIDRQLIESTAITHGEGLDLVLSPATAQADLGVTLDYSRLLAALEACRESYDYILADAPRLPRRVMADLASVSGMNLIVLQLTVRDVTFAGALVAFLVSQGIPPARLIPLANRARRGAALVKLEDGRRAIGVAALYPIRDDWAKAVRSANRGQPLCDVAGRSRLRRDYRRLAAHIHQLITNGGSS